MAARPNRVEVEIVATDEASPKIDRLERKIDGLESDEARVIVSADTARLESQLDSAKRKLDGLEGDEATVQARLVGSIEKDLEDARRLFNQLDGQTGKVTLTADTDAAERDLRGIKSQLDDLAGNTAIGGLASRLATPAGAAGLLAGGLLLAANNAADAAIEADNLARLTGDSVEQASQLIGVWQTTGAEVTDLQDVLLQMSGVLAEDSELARQLGINLSDGATIGERFREVYEILGDIEDATERSMIASKLFGEEGVRQYNALAASVEDLDAKLSDMNTFSAEDAENARQLKNDVADLTREFETMAAAIGGAVIPILGELVGGFNTALDHVERTTRGIRTFFDQEAENNFKIINRFEDAEQAARDFDDTLLEGLTTYAEVRAEVERITGSEHAANVVALEWKANQDKVTEAVRGTTGALEDQQQGVYDLARWWRELDRVMRIANSSLIVDENLNVRAGGPAPIRPASSFPPPPPPSAPVGNVTIINPPGTPAATAGSLNIFLSRNGDR